MPRWESQEDSPEVQLQRDFAEWLAMVVLHESLFKQRVYENTNANEMDYRQHRMRISGLISDGEDIAIRILLLSAKGANVSELAQIAELVDKKLNGFMSVLLEWHGPLESKDIPESFKRGVSDIADGRIVELNQALSDVPAESKIQIQG